MTAFVVVVCAALGLAVGSFLNVVIWRVPRKESVVAPPSHCPSCDTPIAPRDNVPVLSWVLLRAKCRHCGARISARYPLVELATGVLFALVALRFDDSWALPAYLVFAAALLAVSIIDLEHYLIPNRIVYPVGFLLVPLFVVAAAGDDEWGSLGRALLGALVAFSAMFVVHVISPRGMGFGDVRLSFLLGLALGWLGWGELLVGLFLGFLYGSIVGIGLIATRLRTRKQHIPFGPFLAAGALTMVLVGTPILDWYRDLTAT
ncbi:MAG TPA: prepilin peptidase [Acidimicrobiia bacterium]|nr:prepilin peptidase [Acidimicrobiia bacterium]